MGEYRTFVGNGTTYVAVLTAVWRLLRLCIHTFEFSKDIGVYSMIRRGTGLGFKALA